MWNRFAYKYLSNDPSHTSMLFSQQLWSKLNPSLLFVVIHRANFGGADSERIIFTRRKTWSVGRRRWPEDHAAHLEDPAEFSTINFYGRESHVWPVITVERYGSRETLYYILAEVYGYHDPWFSRDNKKGVRTVKDREQAACRGQSASTTRSSPDKPNKIEQFLCQRIIAL